MNHFEADIKAAVATLKSGGILLYPTDTVWGLGCDALNENAIEKIFTLKKRPQEKSLIVLLPEAKDILKYVATPHPDIIDMLENFSEPTTVIYEHPLYFPENILHHDGSIAIRVTQDPFCKALLKRFQKPIISTSANISGTPTPAHFDLITADIKTQVDYIVKHRQEDKTEKSPSAIVRIKDDGSILKIR